MNSDVLQEKEERFFFHMNNFDDETIVEEEVEEDLPPPPPTYSEAELEAAKGTAFEEGKALGVQETKTSRGADIAKSLEAISQNFTEIFAAEDERTRLYEQEALQLSIQIFKKLFPLYNEKCGFDELGAAIETILQKQSSQKSITVTVASDTRDGVEKMLTELQSRGLEAEFSVIADDTLDIAACRIAWADGGARYDSAALADEIYKHLEQTLAGSGAKVHDSKEDQTPIEETQEQDLVEATEEPPQEDEQAPSIEEEAPPTENKEGAAEENAEPDNEEVKAEEEKSKESENVPEQPEQEQQEVKDKEENQIMEKPDE